MSDPVRFFQHETGVFASIHHALVGVDIPWSRLDPAAFDQALVDRARATWQQRAQSEFRSIQIMTRFLTEVLDAGAPLELYSGAADLVVDEIRHTALCVGVCEALGIKPRLPAQVALVERPEFLALPPAQRSLISAITMLAINETISVGFAEDLAERCAHPVIGAVLGATCEDEATHQSFGWSYVRRALDGVSPERLAGARTLVQQTLAPHRMVADKVLSSIPAARRTLEAWPDSGLIELGLLSQERQALLFERTYQRTLAPQLLSVGLL